VSSYSKRVSVFAFVGTSFIALGLAACQPADEPIERVGKQVDHSLDQAADQRERATKSPKQ
jgi:hypothetical protein